MRSEQNLVLLFLVSPPKYGCFNLGGEVHG